MLSHSHLVFFDSYNLSFLLKNECKKILSETRGSIIYSVAIRDFGLKFCRILEFETRSKKPQNFAVADIISCLPVNVKQKKRQVQRLPFIFLLELSVLLHISYKVLCNNIRDIVAHSFDIFFCNCLVNMNMGFIVKT